MGEKTQKQERGRLGENEAADFLVANGYRIIERNYRQKWGEIDIITINPESILVFVEVKAMIDGGEEGIKPEDNLTPAKLRKLQRTCQLYANSNENLVGESGWRIDLVAVDLKANGYDFRHYENI